MHQESTSVEQLLDRAEQAANEADRVSVGMVLDLLGSRSFGPILLLAGLITLAPLIGDIPGMPTLMGILVMLTAGQLLCKRKHVWLPQWMLKRSIARGRFCKALAWIRPVARFLDRFSKPRYLILTSDSRLQTIAVVCMIIAGAMPLMEMIPFSANIAGVSLTAFGLSLTARDGLIALIAMVFVILALGTGTYFVVW
ncbi:MAG: exopolysaccharide biosynthesis protein [Desulfovermiculus sp.]